MLGGSRPRLGWEVWVPCYALTTWGFDFPHLLVGYYLWQASLVALAIGAAVHAHMGPIPPDQVSVIDRRLSPPGDQSHIVS